MSSLSSAVMASPIWTTSFSWFSRRASRWSIFSWATDRSSFSPAQARAGSIDPTSRSVLATAPGPPRNLVLYLSAGREDAFTGPDGRPAAEALHHPGAMRNATLPGGDVRELETG